NSNLSAIDRDVADVRSRGLIAKGALPADIQALLGGKQYEELSADNKALYRQMMNAQSEIKRMGEEPHKDGPSVLSRVMDVLSRGNYAVANVIKEGNKAAHKAGKDGFQLKDIVTVVGQHGGGIASLDEAWEGLSGKKKVTFSDVLGDKRKEGGFDWNPDSKAGKVAKFGIGLAADILLDPTTYIGVGAAKAVVKGGSGAVRAAKIGDVAKEVGQGSRASLTPKTLERLHKEIDKIADLDVESLGYKMLNAKGKPIEGSGLAKSPEIRRQQLTEMFTGARNADGSPVAREQIAQQLRNADHYLAFASKAAVKENAAKAEAALKIVSQKNFLQKTADQIYKDLEATAAADILQGFANVGRRFVDVVKPEPTIKATLNPVKHAAFKKSMDKKIATQRGLLTKAKKAGKPQEELDRIKNKIYDLENERNYDDLYGKPLDDKAPDERIYDVVRGKPDPVEVQAYKRAVRANGDLADDLEKALKEIRPKGIDEARATILEIAAKEIDPEVTRLIQVRFGGMFGTSGAVLATFKAPDIFRKASEKLMREGYDRGALNAYNKATIAFSKTFRASGSLDKFIDNARLRTSGRANELIHVHVQDLRQKFGKIKKRDRIGMYDAFLKGVPPEGLGDDLAPLMDEIETELNDIGRIFDGGMYDQIGEITWQDLNKWLPKKRVKLVEVNGTIPVGTTEWWRSALRESTSRDMAEVLHQLRIAKEKMIARGTLVKSIEDTLGVSRFSASGESALHHQLKEVSKYTTVKGFDDNIIFSPQVASDLTRLMELVDDQAKHMDVIHGFDKALNLWKSAVTVYNPAFHIRNAGGDMFVSFLNGMFVGRKGVRRALRSHKAAIKTMNAMKWSKISPAERLRIMTENPNFNEALLEPGVGSVVLTVPRAFADVGDKITAEMLWGAYLKYGLKQAFTSTEFGKVVSSTSGIRGVASGANDAVRGLSESREDWFRLAHFIDVLQRESLQTRSFERAAAKAAEDVRKFHFDYSDFTPIERSLLTRAIPFYKWTRKSFPLMVEMLFAKPGAISVYPKTLNNLSTMMGYESGTDPLVPDSDAIIPQWIKNRGAVPLYQSAKGNTVFFDPSNPFNDTVRTWQGNSTGEF
ncbi:MAG TPA: hypothetical protein VFK94_03445, partial [Patescibacteria group bacterium]|nr:hypothetical protein [Patescibacteria group bacterium]